MKNLGPSLKAKNLFIIISLVASVFAVFFFTNLSHTGYTIFSTCEKCKGGVNHLLLRNDGPDGFIQVYKNKGKPGDKDKLVFEGFVKHNSNFTLEGKLDYHVGAEVNIFIDKVLDTTFQTSCAYPIGPGMKKGSFTVVGGKSRYGGKLCPFVECSLCSGTIKKLTLKYKGASGYVKIGKTKYNVTLFEGNLDTDDEVVLGEIAALDSDVMIHVDGFEDVLIQTNCLSNIGKGSKKGKFEVMYAESDSGEVCAVKQCGDGNLDPEEECDDGNNMNSDGCDSSCKIEPPPEVCGNGFAEIDEECDDGNVNDGDGCSSLCRIEAPATVCGNGLVEQGEQCDDSNTNNGDGCSSTCVMETSQCTVNLVNSTPGEWQDTGECMLNDSKEQSMQLVQYDSNNCNTAENQTFYFSRSIYCDYCAPDWQEVNVSSGPGTVTGYFEDAKACYEKTGLESDNQKPVNNTYSVYYCTPLLVNTDLSSWSDISGCTTADTKEQQRYSTQYDANNCGTFQNITLYENRTVECDYCTPDVQNSSWSEWSDIGTCSPNDLQMQVRAIEIYDFNYASCYNATGLLSDLWEGENQIEREYKYVACDYCAPEWIETLSRCRLDDQIATYYTDSNLCFEKTNLESDNTPPESKISACDYCTPDWHEINSSCSLDNTLKSYYVDANSCYSQTGLESDNLPPENKTYSCDYCTPLLMNTSWSEWFNLSLCRTDDTQEQERSLIQYDFNSCGEVAPLTLSEDRTSDCDYCTPSWHEVNTSCESTDKFTGYYVDSNSCYSQTYLASDSNAPYDNLYTCDYIISTRFDGDTTNFTRDDLSGLENVALEIIGKGKISFEGVISINRSLDLDSNIEIGDGFAYINTTELPEFDVPARLAFYNLPFVNPMIFAGDEQCNSTVCSDIAYSDGTLTFIADASFTYYIIEGQYCGDSVCQSSENCSTCASDCRSCSNGGGSGSVGSGSGEPDFENDTYSNETDQLGSQIVAEMAPENNRLSGGLFLDDDTKEAGCVESWSCSGWSDCENNLQSRKCFDLDECGSESQKPPESQGCNSAEAPAPSVENKNIEQGITGRFLWPDSGRRPDPRFLAVASMLLVVLSSGVVSRIVKLSNWARYIVKITDTALITAIITLTLFSFMERPSVGLVILDHEIDSNGTISQLMPMEISVLITITSVIITFLILLKIRKNKSKNIKIQKY